MHINIYTLSRVWIFLVAASLFTACDDSFLEIVPEDAGSLEEFWQTSSDVQEALNGAYDVMRSGNFLGGQGQFLSELFADHISQLTGLSGGDWAAHYTRTTDIFLGTTRTFWSDGYKVIGRVNFVLQNMDLIEGISDAEKARITAECKFLRGLAHFELVRLFGQPYGYTADNSHLGVPIRLNYSSDIVPRATVGAVYEQVIGDLSEAAASLPTDNNGYATSWAAKAYLAKVYFQMNDFTNAYAQSNDVLSNGGFQFDTSLVRRFSTEGTSEAVFELASSDFIADNSGGWISANYQPNPGNNNVPNITLSSYVYNLATQDVADKRGQQWYEIDESGSEPLYLSTKFVLQEAMNVPLAHVTELKLIRAESAAELGSNLEQAEQDLSEIRTRAGLTPVSSGTPASSLIAICRAERELEMVSEGNRLHELKRRAVRGENSLRIRNAPWDCAGLVCQIPDAELKGNLDLIPNASGGCN
ncbi:MAG: RagB/SusD family nutrient uptake outer membrane protein [Bacteroidota bacterium]